jgi:hypothetical protein
MLQPVGQQHRDTREQNVAYHLECDVTVMCFFCALSAHFVKVRRFIPIRNCLDETLLTFLTVTSTGTFTSSSSSFFFAKATMVSLNGNLPPEYLHTL